MIWMILALALHPQALAVSGAPGELVMFSVLGGSDEPATLETSGVLLQESPAPLGSPGEHQITARIDPHAAPGTYESYVYGIPDNPSSVILGSALPIQVTVESLTQRTSRVQGTERIRNAFSMTWFLGGIAGIVLLIGAIRAVSFQRSSSQSKKQPPT